MQLPGYRVQPGTPGHLLNPIARGQDFVAVPHVEGADVVRQRGRSMRKANQVSGDVMPDEMTGKAFSNAGVLAIEAQSAFMPERLRCYRAHEQNVGVDQKQRVRLNLGARLQFYHLLHDPAADRRDWPAQIDPEV